MCLATAVLWLHSYFADDYLVVFYQSAFRETDFGSPMRNCTDRGISGQANCGRLVIRYDVLDEIDSDEVKIGLHVQGFADRNAQQALANAPWFAWANTLHGPTLTGEAALQVPLPALFLLTALLPGVALRQVIRKRRLIKTGCRSCGYDLTGNTSGVCPECGKPINVNM
jgi:hypothetical protein